MKKYLQINLTITLIFLTSINAVCQDEKFTFGDEFEKWVSNRAYSDSKGLTRYHFKVYWDNFFYTLEEDGFDLLTETQQLLELFKNVDNLTKSFDQTIELKLKIPTLERKLLKKSILTNSHSSLLTSIDSAATRNYFVQEKLYHHGTSTMMESLGQVSKTINKVREPSITIAYVSKNDQSGLVINSDLSQSEEEIMYKKIIEASAASAGEDYSQGAYYLIAFWELYQAIEEEKKIKKQKEKFDDALKDLPNKILTIDESYSIYKEEFLMAKANHDTIMLPLVQNILLLDSLLEKKFHHINYVDKYVDKKMQQQINSEEISDVEIRTKIINRIYNLKELDTEAEVFGQKIRYLNGLDFIIGLEDYKDVVSENNLIYKSLQKRFHDPITKSVLNDFLRNNSDQKSKLDLLFNRRINARKKKRIIKMLGIKNELHRKKAVRKQLVFSSDTFNGFENGRNNNFLYLSYDLLTNEISVGSADNGNYRDRFINNNGLTNVLHSPYDGGYAMDIRRATYSVRGMKNNITNRINELKTTSGLLNGIAPKRVLGNIKELKQAKLLLENTNNNISENIRSITTELGELQLPEFTAALNQYSNELKITDLFINPKRKVNVFILSREVATSKNTIENEIKFEGKKGASKENKSYEKLLTSATNMSVEGKYRYAKEYLKQAKALRLADKGHRFEDKTPLFETVADSIKHIIEKNYYEFEQCAPPGIWQNDLRYSDCNRFTAQFLSKIYGIDDFISTEGSDRYANSGIIYRNSTDLQTYLPNSDDWEVVGTANNQDALERAQDLSNQGFAVLTIGVGHVNMVVPGRLKESSWGRVPNVYNYRSTRTRDNPNPNGTVINIKVKNAKLSEAYRKKDRESVYIYYRKI
jgi:hypothetical protein